jgi:hypothetical protein
MNLQGNIRNVILLSIKTAYSSEIAVTGKLLQKTAVRTPDGMILMHEAEAYRGRIQARQIVGLLICTFMSLL